ncbi:hypothetical protein GCM10011579_027810 [Streptomyces albiflavescens]|uniref:Uncharacterized protein n=1 Tax=Streptomyces albiflavescens TaxID=1623582 RepID=A0A918D334_9ACTN|nr:hypothetical protein [Streptomyces albiflavescens]GGN61458.1 hypothetical protein GCM10011579_027810 [Streptomyces albiflavescens]
MGWGDTWRSKRSGLGWANAELNVAAALCAAQLAVSCAIWWVGTFDDDAHGAGSGGGLAAAGLLCMLVFGPLLLAVLGLLHAAAHTMPAATLARLATRRVGGSEEAWHLAFVAVLGVLWAAVAVVLGVPPTGTIALLIAASGVVPALGVRYVRRRERATGRAPRSHRIWVRSALASFGACVLVAGVGLVGLSTGLIKEYEPPKLSAEQLAGVWRGDGGAVLRLRAGGRAELTALPAQPEFGDVTTKEFTRCDGTGSWFLDTEGRYDPYVDTGDSSGRDGVVVRIEDCGHDTYWTIGGSEARPELFVLFGDPDSGDLRILKRD